VSSACRRAWGAVQPGDQRPQRRQFLVEGVGALGREAEPGSRSLALVALADLDVAGYPDLDHLSLVAADSPLTPRPRRLDQARLAGKPAHNTC
jgi:hypothetical protein